MNAVTPIDTASSSAFAHDPPGVDGAGTRTTALTWAIAVRDLTAEWDSLAADVAEPDIFAERWFADASRHLAPPEARMMAKEEEALRV